MVFYGLITALTIVLSCFAGKRAWPYTDRTEDAGRYGQGEENGAGQYSAYGMRRQGAVSAALWSCGRQLTRRQALGLVCLAGIFAVLAGVSALRIEVGNDYGKYIDIFHEIYAGTDEAYVVTEAGFNFVVWLLYTLSGYENYLLVFAVFGAATVYIFLKAMYRQSVDFKVSFALFMLLGVYFRTFTTVRYYFVLALTLYSLQYVRRREFLKFVLLILFASLFHKSVLVVLVLYPLAALEWKRWMLAAGGVAAVCVFIWQTPILKLALALYPTFEGTVYLTQGVGLAANASGILRCLFVFALAAVCFRESVAQNESNRFYLKLSVLGFLLYTCASFLPLVSRIAYYVATPQLLLIPGLLAGLGRGRKKKVAAAFTVLFAAGYFLWFLGTASGSGIRVLPYQTWVFTKKEWINGSDFF